MKKVCILLAVLLLSVPATWARMKVTANVESVGGTNNCCYTLWVSVDDIDVDGNVIRHLAHGYVKLGCCASSGIALNPETDNAYCTDMYFNNEVFITSKDSRDCLLPVIRPAEDYSTYQTARDNAIAFWKKTHE